MQEIILPEKQREMMHVSTTLQRFNAKANNTTTPRTTRFPEKELPWVGFESRTQDTLQSTQALYQLSYQHNSANYGFESTTQYLKQFCHGTITTT